MKRQLATIALLGTLLVSAQSGNPKADQISYIAEIQSVLEASLYLHAKGDAENAKRVIGSATGKRWDRAKADLSSADRKAFEDGFKGLGASIDAKEPTDKYEALIGSLDSRMGSLIGAKLDPKDAGVALDRLLVDTAFYYGVGVDGAKIAAPRTYAIAAMIPGEALEIAQKAGLGAEVQGALETLKQRTAAVANTSDVATLVTQARAAVGKATGLTPVALSNQLYMDRARAGLKKADSEYAAGKTDQAVKTMAELYLDGLEYLEGQIAAKNAEMKEAIEKQVGGTIPQAIKDGKPASDVSKQIAEGLTALEKAAALIGLN